MASEEHACLVADEQEHGQNTSAASLPPKYGKIAIPKKKPQVPIQHSEEDEHEAIVHKIGNYKKDEALARFDELEGHHDQTYFEIGGVLSVIRNNKFYEPHESFSDWRKAQTSMSHGKANALVQIYDGIANSDLKWKDVEGIGWTKLREIASVLTKENAQDWVKLAAENSKADLIKLVKAQKAGTTGSEGGAVGRTQTKTFKLHADQKEIVEQAISKAKEQSGTEFDTVALEYVCMDFMNSESLPKKLKYLTKEKLIALFAGALLGCDEQTAAAVWKEVFAAVKDHLIDEVD